MADADPREVYFEFTAIGGSVKVVAIDAATGTEVTVSGPPTRPSPTSSAVPPLGKLKLKLARQSPQP